MKVLYNIKADDLLRFAGVFENRKKNIDPAITKAINLVGDATVTRLVQQIAAETDLNYEAARRLIIVRRASAKRHHFEIDVGRVLMQAGEDRPLPQGRSGLPPREDGFFREGELVNIVTMGDDRVCEFCIELAEANPYTIEEARAQLPHHINCRCVVETARQTRKLPVEMKKGRGREGTTFSSKLTLSQLAAEVQAGIAAVLNPVK